MPKLSFNNCSYCVDLRLGCIIIGYFQLITGLVGSALFLCYIGKDLLSYTRTNSQYQIIADIKLGVVILYLLIFASIIIFNIILIVGLHQNKPRLVKAYLVYKEIFLFIACLLLLANTAFFGCYTDFVIRTVIIIFDGFSMFFIRSYYHKMQESSSDTNTPQS